MATKHRPEHHSQPIVESAMDYTSHEKTYEVFLSAVKYAIISMAILVVGLYFAVIGGEPVVGGVLIIASIIVPAIMAFMSRD